MKDYFTRADGTDELACTCGDSDCTLTMRESSRDKLNGLRVAFGKPLNVFGARCPNHPYYSGPGSSHDDRTAIGGVEACAFDIDNSKHSKQEVKYIVFLGQRVGFNRYGIGNTGKAHMDDDESKVDTFWVYT